MISILSINSQTFFWYIENYIEYSPTLNTENSSNTFYLKIATFQVLSYFANRYIYSVCLNRKELFRGERSCESRLNQFDNFPMVYTLAEFVSIIASANELCILYALTYRYFCRCICNDFNDVWTYLSPNSSQWYFMSY